MKASYNFVFNRTNKALKHGEKGLIQLRITLAGKSKYISTNIKVEVNQWHDKNNKQEIKNHPNSIPLNIQLNKQRNDIEKFELNLINQNKPFTIELLNSFLKGNRTDSFFDFYEKELNEQIGTVAPATIDARRSTFTILKEWRKDVLFSELNFDLLDSFYKYQFSQKKHINTIGNYFKHLGLVIKIAIKKGLLEAKQNPFQNYQVKHIKTERKYLEADDLEKIENLKLNENNLYLERSLDIFLFSCYTGLRRGDIGTLANAELIKKGNDIFIEKVCNKTVHSSGIKVVIPLIWIRVLIILKKYSKSHNQLIFGEITEKVNKELKLIAELAGIKNKKLTMHVGRHTLATFLLNKGMPLEVVSKILGHTDIKTTRIYAEIVDKTVLNEFRKISI